MLLLLFSILSFHLEGLTLTYFLRQVRSEILSQLWLIYRNPYFSFILKNSFARICIFGWQFFSFSTLNVSSYSLSTYKVSVEKSADNFMETPLYVISCFSLAAFKILFLSLTFDKLIIMCLDVHSWFILIGIHWDS